MEPPVIHCKQRNGDRTERGELEEGDTCCEATDYILVFHNSPVSLIPPGPHSCSLNARRREREREI